MSIGFVSTKALSRTGLVHSCSRVFEVPNRIASRCAASPVPRDGRWRWLRPLLIRQADCAKACFYSLPQQTPKNPSSGLPSQARLLLKVNGQTQWGPWVRRRFLRIRPATTILTSRLLADSNARHAVTGQTMARPIWCRSGTAKHPRLRCPGATRCCRRGRQSLPSRSRRHRRCRQGRNRNGECLGTAPEDFPNLVTDPDGR